MGKKGLISAAVVHLLLGLACFAVPVFAGIRHEHDAKALAMVVLMTVIGVLNLVSSVFLVRRIRADYC